VDGIFSQYPKSSGTPHAHICGSFSKGMESQFGECDYQISVENETHHHTAHAIFNPDPIEGIFGRFLVLQNDGTSTHESRCHGSIRESVVIAKYGRGQIGMASSIVEMGTISTAVPRWLDQVYGFNVVRTNND
jgi:hypothetical protein